MASPMKPPAHAPDFLAASGWAGRRDPAACRRRVVPPLFPRGARRSECGADGRAAAARGPAAVHRGRRMAASGGLSAPANPRARPRQRAAAARRFRRARDCANARRRSAARAGAVRACDRRARPSAPASADAGPEAARARSMARGAELFTDWYCPAVGARGGCGRLSRGVAEVLGPVAATGSAQSPCFATITPRTSCWSKAATASRISACSISRTRLRATRRTTSLRCSKMRAATFRRRSSAR